MSSTEQDSLTQERCGTISFGGKELFDIRRYNGNATIGMIYLCHCSNSYTHPDSDPPSARGLTLKKSYREEGKLDELYITEDILR